MQAHSQTVAVAAAGDEQITGGFVAEVLALMAAGKLELRLGSVKVRPAATKFAFKNRTLWSATCSSPSQQVSQPCVSAGQQMLMLNVAMPRHQDQA